MHRCHLLHPVQYDEDVAQLAPAALKAGFAPFEYSWEAETRARKLWGQMHQEPYEADGPRQQAGGRSGAVQGTLPSGLDLNEAVQRQQSFPYQVRRASCLSCALPVRLHMVALHQSSTHAAWL